MYNAQIRQIINRWVLEGQEKGYSVKASLKDKVTDIYLFYETEKMLDTISISMLLSVIYVDSFMIYSYRQKEATNLDSDTEVLASLYDVDDITGLYNDASLSPNLLCSMLEASYEFYNMGLLGKINVVKSLSASENEWLLSRFPNHQENIKLYDIDVPIALIIREAQKMSRYQRDKMLMHFDEAISMNILGFIRNLCKIDPANATEILYELGKIDYMASKYLVIKGVCDEDLILNIDYYENYDIEEVIDNLSVNQNLLMDAIRMLMNVYVHKKYGDIALDEDIITGTEPKGFQKIFDK